MRKSRYRYKRYTVCLPKAIGDLLDLRIEYVVQIFGPAVVLLPKGLENFFSRLENLEKVDRENKAEESRGLEGVEGSAVILNCGYGLS